MSQPSPAEFADSPQKSIALIGMSGVGKTRLAKMLRKSGRWFHYSVDYRIGTRYMGEDIADWLKREGMRSPLLRELLMSNSIAIESRLSFDNLKPLSQYLGRPGDREKGGLEFEEFARRQRRHREAEIKAMRDAEIFVERAREIYGYPHFLCDTSGSLVEVVEPDDPRDALLTELSRRMLFVGILGAERDEEELVARFDRDPKPMYYDETFLRGCWSEYLAETGLAPQNVDPSDWGRWAFRRLVRRRAPRYRALAENWGVALAKEDVSRVETEADFLALLSDAAAAARPTER